MKINLVEYPNINFCKDLESYVNKFFIDKKLLVSFSNPLYNKDKTISIVVVKSHFFIYYKTLIFQKQKNEWTLVADLKIVSE